MDGEIQLLITLKVEDVDSLDLDRLMEDMAEKIEETYDTHDISQCTIRPY